MTSRRRKLTPQSQVFIDAGYIVGMLDDGDQFHGASKAWALKLPHPHRITTTAVLGECGDRFAKRGAWDIFSRYLVRLERDPFTEIVPVDRRLFDRAVALRRKHPSWRWAGITDCISFVVMTDRGITEALSGDGDYGPAGFDALLLRAP